MGFAAAPDTHRATLSIRFADEDICEARFQRLMVDQLGSDHHDRGREEQAEGLGTQDGYIPLHTREDAFRPDLVEAIKDAALIYFPGGDPHHLALSLHNTPAWEAIESSWRTGSSLGGCSAGAMAFGEEIISIRKSHAMAGLKVVPRIQVIPHYDKFLGWLPDRIASTIISANEGTILLGIDEETALVRESENSEWRVWGEKKVHVLKGLPTHSYSAGEVITF